MNIDYNPFFSKYEIVVGMIEKVFAKVKNECEDYVKCKVGCSDCCHAIFDLTLIEAMYINNKFNERFEGVEKANLIDSANKADRKIYQIKRSAHKELLGGAKDVDILGKMAVERVRCPLLDDSDQCVLYDCRPLTCRLYGIPTASGGMSHTCGKSGFAEGDKYPTVNMDALYRQLYEISTEFVKAIESEHVKMADMLVPVSMAVLTDYNDEYLGLASPDDDQPNKNKSRGEDV